MASRFAPAFRRDYDGSQDYDLLLRFTERTDRIGHIPKILYHWRKISSSVAASVLAKPYAFQAAKKALEDALQRRGQSGLVEMLNTGRFRVRYLMRANPRISIIIPTKDKVDFLKRCLSTIEQKSTYKNYEILIVDNNSVEEETFRYLRNLNNVHRVLPYPQQFNWAAINNFATANAHGDYLLFLNNDVEAIEPESLGH